MKNPIFLSLLCLCTLFSCSTEELDISGTYNLLSLTKSCDNPDNNLEVVAGDNMVLGTNVNLAGNMLFTVGGAFKLDYVLTTSFTMEEVFIEGTYSLANDNFRVCGNSDCIDNPSPSGLSQVTMQVKEGDCILTVVGERN